MNELITAAGMPFAVIAIVTNIKARKSLGAWTLPLVAAIGLAVGALEYTYGSSELYRTCVAWLVLALAGSGFIDLKRAKAAVGEVLATIAN